MERQGLNFPERWLRDFIAPFQKLVTSVTTSVGDAVQGITSWRKLEEENRALRQQISDLTQANTQLEEYRLENQRLRALLGFRDQAAGRYRMVAARVIARDPSNWFRTLIIDRGQAQGIRKDMAVVTYEGLVGRVIGVTANTAEVLLIVDQEGAAGAMLQASRTPGIVRGGPPGSGLLEMVHIPSNATIQPNDVVITSGLGGVFPKGLRIGYVERVEPEAGGLMTKATIKPYVDFDRLEEVLIITG